DYSLMSRYYSSFFLHAPSAPPALHSFPTRRSSDLHCASAIFIPSIGDQGGCNPIGVPARLDGGDIVIDISGLAEKSKEIPRKCRSEEHTSELQSHLNLVCRLLLEKKKKKTTK